MAGQAGASQAGGRLLLARAAMFATVAVGLAGAAHLQAHGDTPAPQVGAVAVVILIQLVMLLGFRERGWVPIAALLLLTQLVLHPLFEAFPANPHSAAEHGHLVAGAAAGTSWQMKLAHAAAALVAAWWLRRGEARAHQLVCGIVAATCRPLRAALAAAGTGPAARPVVATVWPDGQVRVLASWDQGTPVGRRGPPAGRVALSG